jgi:hypothetical protein
MPSSSQTLVLSLVAKATSVAGEASITMEMPVAMAMLVMACYSQVNDLLCYTGIPCGVTVHCRSELCGVIICHWTSQLDTYMSLPLLQFSTTLGMLGSDMVPYPCPMAKTWNLIRFGRLL